MLLKDLADSVLPPPQNFLCMYVAETDQEDRRARVIGSEARFS